MNEHPLMTAAEVADAFLIDVNTIYKLVKRGQMPVVKLGRTYRIPRSWVERQLVAQFAESGPRDEVEPQVVLGDK